MKLYTLGQAAEYVTRRVGEYVPVHRVRRAVDRLVASGEIPDRRLGQQRVIFAPDLPALDSWFGITVQSAKLALTELRKVKT